MRISTLQWVGLLSCLLLFAVVIGCERKADADGPTPVDPGATYKATPYTFRQPGNFPTPQYDLSKNPLTVEGIELGRTLFYDTHLSRDSTVSCGFCHQQFAGFAHSDHTLSHGIDGKFGTRNVPSIQNMAWSRLFFWDGGVIDLDVLPMSPMENPVEMDLKVAVALDRVRNNPKYPPLFQAAFGSDTVTTARFLKALSQFMLTMVSADSKYDKYIRKETGGDLTADELAGLGLFQQKCSACHKGDLFTDNGFRNNGLSPNAINDQGRYLVTKLDSDRLMFKVPSLRNVEKTVPYMHDGRFATLEQVLDHYDKGVTVSPTLDPLLRQGITPGIPLSATEKKQIISFLLTLTDNTFINNRALAPR